jgi:type IV secretion system protein VirD4
MKGFGQHWKRLVEGRNSGKSPLSSQCVRSALRRDRSGAGDGELHPQDLHLRLDLWLNPILDGRPLASDFDLRELRPKRMSIYVGVNPDDLHRLRPVVNLSSSRRSGFRRASCPSTIRA